ncbi:hypothetical protein [Amycolatopsis jiangsuensis]|uniref:Neutral/alkaline non-lysosomal ceramidase N-terminal domain-containing protein n=1 Tax=Amycolatopsis jiangsuensis TaxID=1181879 RepID=A0A840J086_9PSEU|nr:hypothetical protein [Amycolatopsis jiangsuensis]MBB4686818.1 hypothetical protein [Amycolatopsis jiangsuensis]
MTTRIGHGQAAIAVPTGTPLGGYAARTGTSTGTLDLLEVHAVTVSAGGARFAWVVADLPAVNTDLAGALTSRLAGSLRTRPELVWLSATHTHSGPDTGCRPGGGRTSPQWREPILQAGEYAAGNAMATEQPSDLTAHTGLIEGVGGQRSGPGPRQDVPVTVLAARDRGRVQGCVLVLPVHPTVLGADNLRVSADLAGAVRRAVSARLDGWAVVATGAAGDVSTRPHRRNQHPEELDRLGVLAAEQVLAILDTPGRRVDVDHRPITGARTWSLGLPPRTNEPAPDSRALRRHLEATLRTGDPVAVRTAETALQGAELAGSAQIRDPRLVVSTVRLGDLALAGFGGEPYLSLEATLASEVDGPLALAGYTCGYLGYLPEAAAYRNAVYEVNIAPTAEGGAELAVREALRLLGGLR